MRVAVGLVAMYLFVKGLNLWFNCLSHSSCWQSDLFICFLVYVDSPFVDHSRCSPIILW